MSRKPMGGIYVSSFLHGTHSGYSNHGCRCEECKRASSAWNRDWYARNRDKRRAQVRDQQRRQRELARTLPPAPMTGKRWTTDEDFTVLRKDLAIAKIAQVLQRSHKSVARRREILRAQGRDWS